MSFGFQWGHDFSAMDTRKQRGRNGEEYKFQWGHGFSAVDTWRTIPIGMSPRWRRFNGATTFQPWIPRTTPRREKPKETFQWGHDFSAVDTRPGEQQGHPRGSRFNGATTFQPWIPPRRVRNRTPFRRFNGATTFQPWILRGRLRHSAHRSPRFNGATTFQPWIPQQALGHHRVVVVSMGPRLFSRGYAGNKEILEGHRAGFNGATTFQPWIRHLGDDDGLLPSVILRDIACQYSFRRFGHQRHRASRRFQAWIFASARAYAVHHRSARNC